MTMPKTMTRSRPVTRDSSGARARPRRWQRGGVAGRSAPRRSRARPRLGRASRIPAVGPVRLLERLAERLHLADQAVDVVAQPGDRRMRCRSPRARRRGRPARRGGRRGGGGGRGRRSTRPSCAPRWPAARPAPRGWRRCASRSAPCRAGRSSACAPRHVERLERPGPCRRRGRPPARPRRRPAPGGCRCRTGGRAADRRASPRRCGRSGPGPTASSGRSAATAPAARTGRSARRASRPGGWPRPPARPRPPRPRPIAAGMPRPVTRPDRRPDAGQDDPERRRHGLGHGRREEPVAERGRHQPRETIRWCLAAGGTDAGEVRRREEWGGGIQRGRVSLPLALRSWRPPR